MSIRLNSVRVGEDAACRTDTDVSSVTFRPASLFQRNLSSGARFRGVYLSRVGSRGVWRSMRRFTAGVSSLAALALGTSAQAIILYSTGDNTSHTTAPAGAFPNSGWQYQG